MKVINNIPKMDDRALTRLFINAQKLLTKNPSNADALTVLSAIQIEWDDRLKKFLAGKYKASTPEQGLLSVVGYKVGNEGERKPVRHTILDYILTSDLPPVASPAYMAEWGHKNTPERYRKLHRVIRVLASSGKTLGNMDKAVIEWEEDLDYLELKWAPILK